MPVPELDDHGLLPAGVHDCTIDELRARFGSFQTSDRRPRLFEKLQALVSEAWSAPLGRWFVVDGSFVTSKPEPNDIDLLLVLPIGHDLRSDLGPAQYHLVSKKSVRRRYGFDIIAVRENTTEYEEAVAFFQQVRGQRGLRKGLLRLAL